MTDTLLTPHDFLCLNVAMLDYPTPDQRAVALALARIAGASNRDGTVGMGIMPPADILITGAWDATSRLVMGHQLAGALKRLHDSGFLATPAFAAGNVFRLDCTTLPERFMCDADAPPDYTHGIESKTYPREEAA
jgi:hypothetical protein